MNTTDFLINTHRISKLYENMLKDICVKFQLTLIEAKIISFLYNNPELDTAGDIVELRMLSKGNVSQAVASLIEKKLLSRTPDPHDRRKIHLSLLPATKPMTDSIDDILKQFYEKLFWGMSEKERIQYEELSCRLHANLAKGTGQF